MAMSEIKCTKCGTVNPDTRSTCGICGHPLHELSGDKSCPACGYKSNPAGVDKCVGCGMSLSTMKAMLPKDSEGSGEECEHWSEKPMHVARTAWLGVGGILILLSGVLGIAHAILILFTDSSQGIMSTYEDIVPRMDSLNDLIWNHETVAGLMIVFGALAAAMSTFAFTRSRYGWTVAGAVFGIAAIGLVVGSFLALIALILVVLSRREFIPECE